MYFNQNAKNIKTDYDLELKSFMDDEFSGLVEALRYSLAVQIQDRRDETDRYVEEWQEDFFDFIDEGERRLTKALEHERLGLEKTITQLSDRNNYKHHTFSYRSNTYDTDELYADPLSFHDRKSYDYGYGPGFLHQGYSTKPAYNDPSASVQWYDEASLFDSSWLDQLS